MAQPQTICRTITLTDEPEQNDAFSGPHQRIADAVAELIQPPDAKGISIGIEGSWGSGKSTVARLLTKKLESDKNIAVVPFDAWAHEGDPLRRTFLETIIKRLQELNWIDQKNWDETIEELANRREVVTTKDNLSITWWGRVIAFTLLFIPIGTAFIGAALREDITFDGGPIAWKFIVYLLVGFVLTLTPLSILLLRIKNEPDLLSLFINKGPTEKTTITSKTVNPTSLEFEDSFKKLLEEALTKDPQNKIVLILDNLDRVDAKDALTVWSTLQTFLQHKGTSRPSWHERVWLLVLYDLQGLGQLWENAETKASGKTAASFIDKSFQIRFEVPALVPSDWSTFLIEKLNRAFEDHTDFDRYEVYRVLAISVEKGNKLPTIRGLKLFINQIGAIHRQWARSDTRPIDTFPLSHIACYVLLRPEVDIIKELYNPGFPSKEYQDLLGSSVRENLAGLAFNVEPGVAQQLLFSDKIKGALLKRTDEDLKTVASLLRKGFWQAFEQIVTTQWASTEASNMAEAALELEESGLLNTAPPPSAQLITKSICDAALTVQAWSPMDHDKAKGLAVLIKWNKDRQAAGTQHRHFTETLFKAIALGLNEHAMRTDVTLNAKDWVDCVNIIAQELDPSLKPNALRILFDTLSEQLRLPDPLQPNQSAAILEILSELQETPGFDVRTGKNLGDLADEGRVAVQLREEIGASPNAVAWIVYVLSRYSSAFNGLPLRTEDPIERDRELDALFSDSMVQTFVEILERFKQTRILFESLNNARDLNRLVQPSLQIVLNSPNAKEFFSGKDGMDRLELVFERFQGNEDFINKLLSEVQGVLNVVDELIQREFKTLHVKLYLLILNTSNGQQEKFISWCIEGLRSVGSDWHFYSRGPLHALAFRLQSIRTEFELGEQFYLALKEAIEQYKDFWRLSIGPYENLASLIGPLESNFRHAFQDHLHELVKNREHLPHWFFDLFGLELRTQLLHSTRPLQVVELLPLIIDIRNGSGLEWLNETLKEAGKDLESKYSNEPAWSELKQAVRRTLTSERLELETYPVIQSIASILNVRLPKNGLIAFATPDNSRICTLSPTSLEPETLIVEPLLGLKFLSEPRWSPDGKKLAYIGSTNSSSKSEILIFDPFLGGSESIETSSEKVWNPSWSPDGQTIAFVEGVFSKIISINLETKQKRRFAKESNDSEWPNWSPDGTMLVFHRVPSNEILVIKADGSNEKAITSGSKDFDPSWSPDGTQITFARWDKAVEKSGIYLVNPDGTELVQLIQQSDARAPTWSPDGTKLLFQVGHGPEAGIYQVDAHGQNKKELTKGISPSWQPILNDGV